MTTPASAAAARGADAELVALCNRVETIEDEIAALVATGNTIEDEKRTEPQSIALINAEQRIYDQPEVTTAAGALAMARAAVVVAPRDTDGAIIWADNSEYLAWSLAEFIVGRGKVA
jgi:hypothetical protein